MLITKICLFIFGLINLAENAFLKRHDYEVESRNSQNALSELDDKDWDLIFEFLDKLQSYNENKLKNIRNGDSYVLHSKPEEHKYFDDNKVRKFNDNKISDKHTNKRTRNAPISPSIFDQCQFEIPQISTHVPEESKVFIRSFNNEKFDKSNNIVTYPTLTRNISESSESLDDVNKLNISSKIKFRTPTYEISEKSLTEDPIYKQSSKYPEIYIQTTQKYIDDEYLKTTDELTEAISKKNLINKDGLIKNDGIQSIQSVGYSKQNFEDSYEVLEGYMNKDLELKIQNMSKIGKESSEKHKNLKNEEVSILITHDNEELLKTSGEPAINLTKSNKKLDLIEELDGSKESNENHNGKGKLSFIQRSTTTGLLEENDEPRSAGVFKYSDNEYWTNPTENPEVENDFDIKINKNHSEASLLTASTESQISYHSIKEQDADIFEADEESSIQMTENPENYRINIKTSQDKEAEKEIDKINKISKVESQTKISQNHEEETTQNNIEKEGLSNNYESGWPYPYETKVENSDDKDQNKIRKTGKNKEIEEFNHLKDENMEITLKINNEQNEKDGFENLKQHHDTESEKPNKNFSLFEDDGEDNDQYRTHIMKIPRKHKSKII